MELQLGCGGKSCLTENACKSLLNWIGVFSKMVHFKMTLIKKAQVKLKQLGILNFFMKKYIKVL